MLVMSRKPGQKVHVGDAVVTVLESDGDNIRLGFDVPQDMLVIREELMAGAHGPAGKPGTVPAQSSEV